MSDKTNQARLFNEMIVDEKFFSTPDMGEYLDNGMITALAKDLSDKSDKGQYFIEQPFSTELGYHPTQNVFVISGKPGTMKPGFNQSLNSVDGDTIFLKLNDVQDGNKKFEFEGKTFDNVRDWIYAYHDFRSNNDEVKIRFLGINAPEIPHFRDMKNADSLKKFEFKYGDIKNKSKVSIDINNHHIDVPRADVHFMPFIMKNSVFQRLRKDDDKVTLVLLTTDNNDSPNPSKCALHEVIQNDFCSEPPSSGNIRICITADDGDNFPGFDPNKYFKQGLAAQSTIVKELQEAQEVIYVLDGTTLKNKKGLLPYDYRTDYEKLAKNPFNLFSDVYKQLTKEGQSVYNNLGMRFFGQEFNGRCLGAVYIKKQMKDYGTVWINLNKYIAFKYDQVRVLELYTDSPDNQNNLGYASDAFKLWTYDINKQHYIDSFQDFNSEKGGDDREDIQKKINPNLQLDKASNYTAMIGDVLLTVPPTSIRVLTQNKSQRFSLLRSKGSMVKELPKSERIIEMYLYFNKEDGINGTPVEWDLPNGETVTYYMNGLRALIAQFKYTPYLPITNAYLNQTLNIEAVSLVSYQVSTLPNYPRTVQAVVKFQEFDYRQFMPEILPPDIEMNEKLTTNLFAKTIHFPVMRYYYQRAIWNGENLAGLEYNSEPYLEATVGQRTSLQPVKFETPLIDFYVANEEKLKMKKQLKINLESKPLGTTITFNQEEKNFLFKLGKLYSYAQKSIKASEGIINKFNATDNKDGKHIAYAVADAADHYYGLEIVAENQFRYIDDNKKLGPRKEIKDNYAVPFIEAMRGALLEKEEVNSIILSVTPVLREFKLKTDQGTVGYQVEWGLQIKINWSAANSMNISNKIRNYLAKKLALTKEEIFKDDCVYISYAAKTSKDAIKNNWHTFTELFKPNVSGDLQVLSNVADLFNIQVDGDGNITNDDKINGEEVFDKDDTLGGMKDNMDIETAKSITFDKYEIGTPIVTNMSFTYNNLFNDISLKAVDGYASQYTGGSDTTIDLTITTRDEFTVSQLQLLPRICTRRMLDYRKIMSCSPLRIKCEIAQLMGINEVIIESVSIDTVPNHPGLYEINLRLNSVDRTLRNKEALKKIDYSNAHNIKDDRDKTKDYLALNDTLAKVELYPDLELPTISELEKKGFYFIRYKNKGNRVFPDADFYFVYLHAFTSQMLRDTIVKYFNNEDHQKLVIELMDTIRNDTGSIEFDYTNEKNPIAKTVVDNPTNGQNGEADNSKEEEKNLDYYEKKAEVILKKKMPDADASTIESYKKDLGETLMQQQQLNELKEIMESANYNSYSFNLITKMSLTKPLPLGKAEEVSNKGKIYARLSDGNIGEKDSKSVIKDMQYTLRTIILNILKKPIEPNSKIAPRSEAYEEFFKYLYFEIAKIEKNKDFSSAGSNTFGDGYLWTKMLAEFEMDGPNYALYLNKYFENFFEALASGATGFKGKMEFEKPKDHPKEWQGNPTIQRPVGDGTNKQVKNIMYPVNGQGISDYVLAGTEEEEKKGVIFGAYAIKKYSPQMISMIYGSKILTSGDGFIDPYYNKTLARLILEQDVSDEDMDKRIADYSSKLCEDNSGKCFAAHAMFRNMLVWLYKVLSDEKNQAFVSKSIYLLRNVDKYVEDLEKNQDGLEDDLGEWFKKQWFGMSSGIRKGIFKDDSSSIREAEVKKQILEEEDEIEKKVKEYIKNLSKNTKREKAILLNGMWTLLGILALGDFQTPVFQSLASGNIQTIVEYMGKMKEGYIDKSLITGFTDVKINRFLQALDYDFTKDGKVTSKVKSYVDPMNKFSPAAVTNRVYLKMADQPSIYLMHSFYDMVMHDMRGRMARAFPTYYMLLVDEGREIGLWRLQDNFYDVSSIVEFQVVKSRKIAADTASISMTNLFGTYTTEDEDMKDEYQYTFKDVFNSIFSPRAYFDKEFSRRANARQINRANLKAGARVHLRAGYEADASSLPVLFNGTVAEIVPGDIINIVCQGDGIELSNPNMFNPTDADDVADLDNNSNFFSGLFDAFTQKTTPRAMLINPLTAQGTFIQELIKDISHSRFFNANPFGIVHFGDRQYKEIFTADGEVAQNIYEGISRPSWNGEYSLTNIESEYALETAPEIRVEIQGNRSYWDLMNIAAAVSPDFICAIAPFRLRSSIFYGHPRYYYAYDYTKSNDGQILEKRKPFQQYHVYTSYTDIIGNEITASSKDIRTNARGIYTGPGVLSKKVETIGPLWVDIDIYPENQKSTTINCGFEYKNTNAPITIPIWDWVQNEFSETGGYQIAWRATANGLRECMKEMYQGELIVVGDPTVKPYDRFYVYDDYEDMQGLCEVEQVVHTMSSDTGFITSITPDCISAIDEAPEKVVASSTKNMLFPAIANIAAICVLSSKFQNITRGLFMSASKTINLTENYAKKAINSIGELIGKEDLAAYKGLSDDYLKTIGTAFGLTKSDYNIFTSINALDKAYNAIPKPREFSSRHHLLGMLDDIAEHPERLKDLNPDNLIKELETALDSINDKMPGAANKKKTIESAINNAKELKNTYEIASKDAIKGLSISSDELKTMIKHANKSIEDLNDVDDIRKAIDSIKKTYVDSGKALAYTGDAAKFKDDIKTLRKAMSNVNDFTDKDFIKVLKNIDTNIFKNSKDTLESFRDVKKAFQSVNSIKKGGTLATAAATFGTSLLWAAAEWVITKNVQEFIERELRNLQVLTIFPLMKNNKAYTAGLLGSQGAIFGSPSYDEPGFIEEMAIWFFDDHDGFGVLDVLRDFFITTEDMQKIVSKYKRDDMKNYSAMGENSKRDLEQQKLLKTLVDDKTGGYNAYKKTMLVPRVEDLSSKSEAGKVAFTANKIVNVTDINNDKRIMENLSYIFQSDAAKKLHKKGVLRFSAEGEIDKDNIKAENIATATRTDGTAVEYKCKKIESGKDLPVYDIPYLRPDAVIILNEIIKRTANRIQPDWESENSDLNELHSHNIVVQNATRINENKSWFSTGYMFTVEVKNSKILSNILSEMNADQQSAISKTFSYKIDKTMNENTYNVLVSPRA